MAFIILKAIISTTNIKLNGESGHNCLIPLGPWNGSEVHPLRLMLINVPDFKVLHDVMKSEP